MSVGLIIDAKYLIDNHNKYIFMTYFLFILALFQSYHL